MGKIDKNKLDVNRECKSPDLFEFLAVDWYDICYDLSHFVKEI